MAAVALLDHASPNIMGEFPSAADPFDISDYMLFHDDGGSERLPVMSASMEAAAAAGNFSSTATATATATATTGGGGAGSSSNNRSGEVAVGSGGGGGGGGGLRIAFRTQSEQEIMDDGFKWRKYGKKAVKNSPNPRNYYRCSTEGCTVKKRVERDREDPSYVITTYEGIHNHTSPGVVYYTTQDRTSGQFLVAGCRHIPPTSSSQC